MKYNFISQGGIRLSEAVSRNIPGLTLNKIKALIKQGEVRLNGVKQTCDFTTTGGESISIYVPNSFLSKVITKYIYSDYNVVVVDKPPLTDTENNLTDIVKKDFPTALPMHRLDRNTRGLVVFALNSSTYKQLYMAFKNKNVDKYYYALVNLKKNNKAITKNWQQFKAFLYKDANNSLVQVSESPAKNWVEIITKIRLISDYSGYGLVELMPITGKTHQLRAHLSYLGYPIIGDGKYGSKDKDLIIENSHKVNQGLQLACYKLCFNGLEGNLGYLNGKNFVALDIN